MVVTVKAKLSNELFLLPHDLLAAPQKPLVKLSAKLISFSHLQNKQKQRECHYHRHPHYHQNVQVVLTMEGTTPETGNTVQVFVGQCLYNS